MVGDFGAGGVAWEVELLGEVGVPGEGGEWGGGVGWWTGGGGGVRWEGWKRGGCGGWRGGVGLGDWKVGDLAR